MAVHASMVLNLQHMTASGAGWQLTVQKGLCLRNFRVQSTPPM